MNSLIYLIAVCAVIGWALGFFALGASGIIHLLLVLAAVAILLRIIKGENIA